MDEESAIARHPRVRLIDGGTPIQPLRRIEVADRLVHFGDEIKTREPLLLSTDFN